MDRISRKGEGVEAKYSAMTIAKWFVAWAQTGHADRSNLKIQKLLYYAQGHYLDQKATPLFYEPLEAWSHGPVVSDVYHQFKRFESFDIQLSEDEFSWDDVDEETTQFLIKVWETYGQFAAWRLRDMTHAERPWRDHFSADRRHAVIPIKDIQVEFANRN